jgi:hypothetical protein
MIKNLSKIFMALCLLTVGGGIVANAQMESDIAIEANVPFSFVVGNTTLPAGTYQIKALGDMEGALELRSAKGHSAIAVNTESVETKRGQIENKSELVFNKVGDQYFLYQVWLAGSASGAELPKSRLEKKLTDGGSQPERHSVAALLKHLKP